VSPKLLALKAVIAVAGLSGCGIAVAASTGHLTGGHHPASPATPASARATHAKDGARSPASSAPGQSSADAAAAGKQAARPAGTPSASPAYHQASGQGGNSDSGSAALHATDHPTVAPVDRVNPQPTGKPSLYPGANS
jgi:hypothetical protein